MSVNWISTDERLPEDGQVVLAAWQGSWVAGMETLIYHAEDAPDGPERWCDVHGERCDRPTHWTTDVEMPK